MTLSYGSQFGYYGLRLNPTLEQVIGSVRKPLRIPLPDRRAKWYALSPYRALILDAEREANDYESATLDYRNSGAHLPEAAAAVRPSDAGEDHSFRRIDEHHRAIALQSAYETAYQTMDKERKGRTRQQAAQGDLTSPAWAESHAPSGRGSSPVAQGVWRSAPHAGHSAAAAAQ